MGISLFSVRHCKFCCLTFLGNVTCIETDLHHAHEGARATGAGMPFDCFPSSRSSFYDSSVSIIGQFPPSGGSSLEATEIDVKTPPTSHFTPR